MGTVGNGFAGGFSGRLGNVIGYQWRGRWCVRSMPSQYRDARSEMQLAQRALFRQMMNFISRAKKVLKVGLQKASLDAQMSECNYFMSINKRCFSMDGDVLSVDYESLRLSEGPVAPVAFYVPQMVDDLTVSVGFDKNPLRRAVKSGDEVYLVAYCPEVDDFALSSPSYRYAGNIEMVFNRLWRGREVHLWGFVRDRAGRASLCQYIGCGVLDAAVQSFVSQEDGEGDDMGVSAGEQPSYQSFRSDGGCKEPSLPNKCDGGRSAPM